MNDRQLRGLSCFFTVCMVEYEINGCVQAQSGMYYEQDVGNGTSYGHPRVHPDHPSLFVKGLTQKGSPPWREDDKDGHYMFAVGENLTSRCNYNHLKYFSLLFLCVYIVNFFIQDFCCKTSQPAKPH